MFKKTNFVTALAAAAVLGSGAHSASAQVVAQAQFLGTDLGQSITFTYNGSSKTGFAGQLKYKLAPQGGTNYGPLFETFCVDLDHTVSTNDTYGAYIKPTSTLPLNNGGHIAYIYNKYGKGPGVVTDNAHAAALQLAIWDMSYDSDFDITTGNVKYTTNDTFRSLVTGYLNEAKTNTDSASWLDASENGAISNHKQNVLAYNSATVPEPGLMSLLGCAPIVGSVIWGKRRKRA